MSLWFVEQIHRVYIHILLGIPGPDSPKVCVIDNSIRIYVRLYIKRLIRKMICLFIRRMSKSLDKQYKPDMKIYTNTLK